MKGNQKDIKGLIQKLREGGNGEEGKKLDILDMIRGKEVLVGEEMEKKNLS